MPRTLRAVVAPSGEVNIVDCVNRCVRRAFLCGHDAERQRSFEHRREWTQDRLEFLAGVMAINVLGFAVMSNHVHVVVCNRSDLVSALSDDDVRRRWWSAVGPAVPDANRWATLKTPAPAACV